MLNQKSNFKNQNHNSKVKNDFGESSYNYYALDVDKIEINKLLIETGELANILAASLLTMKSKKQIWFFICVFEIWLLIFELITEVVSFPVYPS